MIIMKFGGSSVGTADAIRAVARAVEAAADRKPVIVVSALFGVTDLLIEAVSHAERRAWEGAIQALGEVRAHHHNVISELFTGGSRERMLESTEDLLDECESVLRGIYYLKEVTPRSYDLMLSFGERLSAPIVAGALPHGKAVDAREIVITDGGFGGARVQMDPTRRRVHARLAREEGTPVVTGFIGATADGITTTLGRGGSDYTATLLGAALDAEEVWICKDVDGVLSADPRVVDDPMLIPKMSYDEAAELSHFGAKVLHPKTMIPVIEKHIPIRLRNTFRPDAPGTVIMDRSVPSGNGVKAVTAIKGLSMVSIEGKGVAGIVGFAAQLFSIAARLRINILMFTQSSSEQVICLVVTERDGRELKRALDRELNEVLRDHMVDAVMIEETVSAVAVIGEGMRGRQGVAGRVFTAAAGARANILAIAQGSSERNISFIVKEGEADDVVRALHDAFELSSYAYDRHTAHR